MPLSCFSLLFCQRQPVLALSSWEPSTEKEGTSYPHMQFLNTGIWRKYHGIYGGKALKRNTRLKSKQLTQLWGDVCLRVGGKGDRVWRQGTCSVGPLSMWSQGTLSHTALRVRGQEAMLLRQRATPAFASLAHFWEIL